MAFNDFDDDKLREECGIFGIYGHPEAAAHTVLGLHALQHRGQEAAGVVSYNGTQFFAQRVHGLVGANLTSEEVISTLVGDSAIDPQEEGENKKSLHPDSLATPPHLPRK